MSPNSRDLRAQWAGGQAPDAGRLLFESVPPPERPAWAARLVALALSRVPSPAAVEAIVAIAASPARWAEAHAAFSAIRVLTLQAERAGPGASPQLRAILYLAENAAKVTYNASGRPAPFDADAGHWLASNLRVVVERLADAPFEERAWLALTSHLDAVT